MTLVLAFLTGLALGLVGILGLVSIVAMVAIVALRVTLVPIERKLKDAGF